MATKGHQSIHQNHKNEVTIGKQTFEVTRLNPTVFLLEQSKEGRKKQLAMFINQRLNKIWASMPIERANLERQYIKELLASL